jgi:hypothetical protein
MRSGDLGKPAGNWLQRGLGHLVGPRGFLADAVDQLGLVPREVELREHPDSPGLGVNIGTTASVDEAIAMGRRFLEEAAAHDRKREGIWVWYTRPSGALTRVYVEPEPDQTPPGYNAFHGPLTKLSPMPPWGGTWTPDQVNSADFAVTPSEAARRVVERPWDTAVPENPITKEEPPMQDEKLVDRLERESKEAGNVTSYSLNHFVGGLAHATITTTARDHPVDVVVDAEIGPKQITELRIRLHEADDEGEHRCDFVELEDQDGEGVGHFESVDDGDGYRYVRIPIKPWPGTQPDPGKVMVNSHVETARRLLAQARPALEGADVPAFTKLDGAAMTVLDAIDELDKAPIVPGGVYAELKHAIARGDAAVQAAGVFEGEVKAQRGIAHGLRQAIAAVLPTIRDLAADHHQRGGTLTADEGHAIAELERAAVGVSRDTEIDDLRRRLEAGQQFEERQRQIIREQGDQLQRYAASSRVLVKHLAGDDPAWWVQAATALDVLGDLVDPPMLLGGEEPTDQAKRP